MRVFRVASLLALLCLPVWAQAMPTAERARELRQALGEVLKDPGPAAYASYFDSFPSSLAEFQELFATQKYRALLEHGMSEGSISLYFVHACKAYDAVGAERYVEKFLRIAAEAGSWGGPPNVGNSDLLTAGSLFQSLLFRSDCNQPTQPQLNELQGAIITNAARSDDARLENIYVSIGWDGEGSGMEWSPFQWVLEGVCNRAPSRCALTRQLTDKYKALEEE